MKKTNVIMLLALVFLLLSCRTEELSTENASETNLNLKTLSTGIHKMSEAPLFEKFLRDKVLINNYFEQGKFTYLLNDNQPIYIVNKNNKISYSTVITNPDSSFNVLVYTIGTKESFFIAEYIPDSNISNNTMYNFTGVVNYKTINQETVGSMLFEKGKPLSESSKTNSKSTCTTTIITLAHSCKSSKKHMPWEQCDLSGDSAPYYETFSNTFCEGYQDTFYNDWQDGGSYGSPFPPGGFGINEAYYYLFVNNPDIKAKYNTFSADVKTFLRNNFDTTEDEEFFKFSVNFFYENPNMTIQQFQNWFIDGDTLLSNLTFDSSISSSNSIVFNNLADFKIALEAKNNVITEESVLQENGSEKIVSARVKRAGVWGSGEEVRVKLKKINNVWTFDSVTSSELGLTLGVWTFTQIDYTQNTSSNVLTVEVTGYENYNVFLEGLGTIYKDKVMIRVKINTNTGNIFSVEFINL